MSVLDGSLPVTVTPPWISLTSGTARPQPGQSRSNRRTWIQVTISAVVVIVGVALFGVLAARHFAEGEATADTAATADLIAEAVVQPILRDELLTGEPAAITTVDRAVADVKITQAIVRVKLWDADGRVLYSDQPALIGQVFPLEDDQLDVLAHPRTRSAVSDLHAPENIYERGNGNLFEVYRPVWTPSGRPLLFEVYFRCPDVLARMDGLWRAFGGLTLGSIVLLLTLLSPVLWRLLRRLRKFQLQREGLLQHAVDASTEERRRIAGELHDGVVQDLVATSLAVSGAAHRAASVGDTTVAAELTAAASTVRASIAALRSLLVGIYPPNLGRAGLASVLEDLAMGLRSRGIAVEMDLVAHPRLTADEQRLIFRVAQECFTNTARHARANKLDVRLTLNDEEVMFDIRDNGTGFDAEAVLGRPSDGHFGLHILGDVASAAGAHLRLATAAGAGTQWQLQIPRRMQELNRSTGDLNRRGRPGELVPGNVPGWVSVTMT